MDSEAKLHVPENTTEGRHTRGCIISLESQFMVVYKEALCRESERNYFSPKTWFCRTTPLSLMVAGFLNHSAIYFRLLHFQLFDVLRIFFFYSDYNAYGALPGTGQLSFCLVADKSQIYTTNTDRFIQGPS